MSLRNKIEVFHDGKSDMGCQVLPSALTQRDVVVMGFDEAQTLHECYDTLYQVSLLLPRIVADRDNNLLAIRHTKKELRRMRKTIRLAKELLLTA